MIIKIKKKLILVKNKESWAYWGKLKDKGFNWNKYKFILFSQDNIIVRPRNFELNFR